ncbi:MAG TPA: hypothetical protein VFW73_13480 [Lacipirellulaceae bacterium]|nr:hypothetical protein [Lacipirellulaceae bacterium]
MKLYPQLRWADVSMHLSAPANSNAIRRWATPIAAFALGLLACSWATVTSAAPPAERHLAPGVLTTIPPSFNPDDTVSTHDVMEIRANKALNWKPDFLASSDTLYSMADQAKFRRSIFCLEFSFKPLRMIEVDVPLASGASERKLVWYLVYRVRNTGQVLKPVAGENGVYTTEMVKGGPVRFLPQFVLQSQDRQSNGQPVSESYLDRVIPAAVVAISNRETPGHTLLNDVEISKLPIPVSEGRIDRSVWGVATWVDVDPRIDFFSIYVGGLTNAYQWTDRPSAYHLGDAPGRGRQFAHKVLQLNFWRPGDAIDPNEQEFRYGVPLDKPSLYGVADGVAYRWVYR